MRVGVKVCGLTRGSDARAAAEAGATYGGVILSAGSPRSVRQSVAAELFGGAALRRCGVFVNEPLERVREAVSALALDVVQLHGDEPPSFVDSVRAAGGVVVWKAVRPRGGVEFAAMVARYGSVADALLLDGWSAAARGGTGQRFPWREVAPYRDRVPPGTELIIAGGLTPENVAEAVALLRPAVVDVSSGVELAPGIKDPHAVSAFVDAVRSASLHQGAN